MLLRASITVAAGLVLVAAITGPTAGLSQGVLETPTPMSTPQLGTFIVPTPIPPDQYLSIEEAVQRQVDLMACHDASGIPEVLVARRVSASELSAWGLRYGPNWDDETPLLLIVLGGDFNLNGLFPGSSGWASQVAFVYDLRYPGPMLTATMDNRLLPDAAGPPPPQVRPSRPCARRPIPSRDPRLAQNCDSRQFAIVPRVCGRIEPIHEQVEIGLDDNVFVPAELSVPDLTEVTWVNYGQSQHTIAGPGWQEPVVMNPGDTWVVTYTSPGTFEYSCTIHPQMRFRLTVGAGRGSRG